MYNNNPTWRSARDTKANIAEAQIYLRAVANATGNIPRIFPDGIFGPETTQAVIQFQQLYELPITGIIDFDTWNALRKAYEKIELAQREPLPVYIFPSKDFVVNLNHSGDEVFVIQIMLNRLSADFSNIPLVNINGIFDLSTSDAVKKFQQANSAKVTGNVDKFTWDLMVRLNNDYMNN